MFGKLKEKLKSWTQKISQDKEEEIVETKVEEKEETKKKDKEKSEEIKKKSKDPEKKLEEAIEETAEEIVKESHEEPEKKEKTSFFKRLFSKEEPSEESEEKTPEKEEEKKVEEKTKKSIEELKKEAEEKIKKIPEKLTEDKKKTKKGKPKEETKPETKKDIIKDIEESGVPEKIAEAEEKLDEEITKEEIKVKDIKSLKKPEKKERSKEKEQIEDDKEIKLPMKFDVAKQKYEPDTDGIKEAIQEQIREAPKPGTQSFFEKITGKINKTKITEKEFEVYAEELEMLLLENNVALEVAERITTKLKEEIVGKELLKKEIESEITEVFKEIIREILIEPFDLVKQIKEKRDQEKEPYVIIFCGINGTGKTTTIAKIAEHLKKNNLTVILAAGDTFRAASIEQLKTHGEKLGIKVIANEYGSDPASVGFDAIKYAKKNLINCVLIDTAGRMHTAKNLLKEMEKIVKVCKPDKKIFVGESITGNDVIEQARSFDWAIGIDGVVLTKADIDEKGGTALSVGYVTKKPILYLGTGQEYHEIEVFDKEKFIEKLGL